MLRHRYALTDNAGDDQEAISEKAGIGADLDLENVDGTYELAGVVENHANGAQDLELFGGPPLNLDQLHQIDTEAGPMGQSGVDSFANLVSDGWCNNSGTLSCASSHLTEIENAVPEQGSSGSQQLLSAQQHKDWFESALFSTVNLCEAKMPWEQGIFKQIFEDGDGLPPVVPEMSLGAVFEHTPLESVLETACDAVKDTVCPKAAYEGAVYPNYVQNLSDKDYFESRESLMDAALCKLLIVVRHCALGCVVGRQMVASKGPDTEAECIRILQAVVGTKSPNTVVKRANSLLSFLRWVAKQPERYENPFKEELVWEYFSWLQSVEAPATRASSCMSALRFAYHVLGMDSLKSCMESRRLTGLSERMLCKKQLLRQSSPLTVNQVKLLRKFLDDESNVMYDRACAAYFLVAIYGRCRHSDLAHIQRAVIDCDDQGGYLELLTAWHKTGRGADKKTKLLPILIPGTGVDGKVWIGKAESVFGSLGLNLEGELGRPLLPAPSNVGDNLSSRGLTSSEASGILRSLTHAMDQLDSEGRFSVTSHSAKSTTLSWAAKFGLSPATRSILGRHSNSLVETYTIYSRDLVVAPTRELQRVINDIAIGRFAPDAPRREFFVKFPPDPPQEATLEEGQHAGSLEPPICKTEIMDGEEQVIDLISSDESEESSSSDADSSASSELEEPPTKVKRFKPKIPIAEKWYVHRKSHILHKLADNQFGWSSEFLLCGKRLTEAYCRSTESSAWNVMCRMCGRKS